MTNHLTAGHLANGCPPLDKYNEPLIFEEWAARHGVIYSLEDEHGLRGSFDECVATMLREGTHRQVHSRLLLACSRSS